MRVLVMGGTAFIGPAVVEALRRRGHEIGLFHRGKTGRDRFPGLTHLLGDRTELDAHGTVLRDFAPDAVIDMMALTGAETARIRDLFRGVARRYTAVSSMDAFLAFGVMTRFENGPVDPAPLTEESSVRTRFYLYREMSPRLKDYEKIHVEQETLKDDGLEGSVVRLPAVYGPGDYQHRLFPYLKRFDDGRETVLLDRGHAANRSARGHVENMGEAIALAATHQEAAGHLFLAAEEPSLSEEDWIAAIGKAAGWKGRIVSVAEDRRPAHLDPGIETAQHLIADTTKIRTLLGFEEVIGFEEGLGKTVAWERAHPPKNVNPAHFDYDAEDELIGSL